VTFVQGPEVWLNQLGVNLACVVAPEKAAVLDEEHRVFVNYETYYLSSTRARTKFVAAPWRYSGAVTDPVSRVRFQPDEQSPVAEFRGRVFYFSSVSNAAAFAKEPAEFATPVVPFSGRM